MNRKKLIKLFLSMLKIGAFTFGGGYAMIALLQREFVENKKWIDNDEFFNLVAIAESSPGPIAINSATYIGYKTCKTLGAFLATVAMCIPSFTVIYLISLFFDSFLSFEYVAYAFKGIQACVIYLIISAGIKMIKQLKKNVFTVAVLCVTVGLTVAFSIFAVNFSSVFYIFISGMAGLMFYYVVPIIRQKIKA